MTQRGVYLWIVAKKNIDLEMHNKILEAYKSVKSIFLSNFSFKRLLKPADL